jgi:hypothetical protein
MVGVETTSNRSKGAGQLMIAIVLIALAAGWCVGADVRLDDVGRAGFVAALHYGTAAAHGGGARMGTVDRNDRWHRGRFGFGIFFGLRYCIAFAIAVALPAWWLGHLALLGRPLTNTGLRQWFAPAAPQLEWYPLGRILLWIAGFAILAAAMSLVFGKGADVTAEALRSALLQALLRLRAARPAKSNSLST